jgi:catechol 2,3-dioxygenase-like lactoylglutathione lyase family enzyme
MLTGAHCILYSQDPAADRAFFRDVLGMSHVDAGDGWLIFALPPAELAVHPAAWPRRPQAAVGYPGTKGCQQESGAQEVYLICDDLQAFLRQMAENGIPCTAPTVQTWGLLTHLTLPGGGTLGVYQPAHPRPEQS